MAESPTENPSPVKSHLVASTQTRSHWGELAAIPLMPPLNLGGMAQMHDDDDTDPYAKMLRREMEKGTMLMKRFRYNEMPMR